MSPDSSSEARFCMDCPDWTFQSVGFHRKGECEAGVSTCNDAGTFNDRSGICDCFELDKGPACDGVLASVELWGSGTDAQDDEGFDLEESTLDSIVGEIIGITIGGLISVLGTIAAYCFVKKNNAATENAAIAGPAGAGNSNNAFVNPAFDQDNSDA